jgi:hypothetical protein
MGAIAGDDEARTCLRHKLDGLYIFSATGYTIASGVAQPKAIVEMIRLNGDGTLTSPAATVSINGTILRSSTVIGTYTVEPNCTGTLTFANGFSFDTFLSPSGDDFWMIQTNPNNVFQGNVTRVSR